MGNKINIKTSLVMSLFLLAIVSTAGAEIIYVDADASTGGDGQTWGTAYKYLQDALAAATSGDEIWVAAGTYKPTTGSSRTATFQLINGVGIYGGFAGGETSLDERDWEANETILSGDIGTPDVKSDNSYHVVTGSGTDATAILDGFTITAGNANGGGLSNRGGGMYNSFSSPTVTNCRFRANSASYGGGMYNSGLFGNPSGPTVVNCTFIANSATQYAGGMWNYNYSSPELVNCTFSGNSAGSLGGGMHNILSDPDITNCILWGNTDSGPQDESAQIHGGTPVINYCCVQGWTGGLGGTANIGDDPLFVDTDGPDNIAGTADDNLRLLPGSPCIDAGDNTAVPAGVTTDLDGNPRIINGTVDMGAYEYQFPIDTNAPQPDPMEWATPSYATSSSSIAMVATTATDPSGVEYRFECVAGGGHDSAWQDGTFYEDTGLDLNSEYTYRVKARDKSVNQNETDWSVEASATTFDNTPPQPDPMEWATPPYATSSSSIAMVATTATDPSGVEYRFECVAGGGHDSNWQDGTFYEDTGLDLNSEYTYRVKARDKSVNQNETDWSMSLPATTFAGDWASNPRPRHRQELSAEEVTLLSWTPGINAAIHKVYFGTSLSDVNESATPAPGGEAIDVNYYDPGPIEWETTYYWRVDEVNDGHLEGPWTGPIWTFTTGNYAFLDGFESYDQTGWIGEPNALRYKWRDGFSTYPVLGSGSNIMLAGMRDEYPKPYLHYEDDDRYEGEQGLVFYYDNDGNTSVPGWPQYIDPAPKYSEIKARTTDVGFNRNWLRKDIKALSLWFKGNPTRTGSFEENVPSSGKYTIISNGADIGDIGPAGGPYHDEFHYAYKRLYRGTHWTGSGEITARIDSVENTDPWAKAGVMMREGAVWGPRGLFPDSNYVMVVVTPGQGVSLQFRDEKRGVSTNRQLTGITAPHWVKLTRNLDGFGNFEAWHANDVSGSAGTWYRLTPDDVNNAVSATVIRDPNIYIGLCLTSHNPDAMCEAVFSNVTTQAYSTTSGTSTVSATWGNRDIGILSNDPEPMYLALEDTSHNVGVKYHEDPNAALIEDWTEWNIDLADPCFNVVGDVVDMSNVDYMYIGFGDRYNKPSGGSGVVYFDDIKLYRSRFIPGVYPAMPTNIVYDEVIDWKDLKVMAEEWLTSGIKADLDDDNNVNFMDFALLADDWLRRERCWPEPCL